jgi:hypothetical protein
MRAPDVCFSLRIYVCLTYILDSGLDCDLAQGID